MILNKSKNLTISETTIVADTFISRMIGLLNRKGMSPKEALIITRCNSIHMFFMRFAIDAIFVNKENKVVGLVKNIKPFRLSPIFLSSSFVIELPAGTIQETGTEVGDQLDVQE